MTDLKRKEATLTKPAKTGAAPETISERVLNFELEITGLISAVVVLGHFLLESPLASKSLMLSYKVGHDAYDKGVDDFYFVGFWVVAFTFLRASIMKYIYHPLGRLVGIAPFGKRQRFAEQGFVVTYSSLFWTLGMYIMYNSPYWFDTTQYWIDYPHIYLTRLTKYYYLMQLAFWFQQLYVIHIEKRRKDHYAMLFHHFITITLLVSSYYTNFTRIGNAVLCCMDVSDILLAFAKLLKYLGFTTLCDIAFATFAIAWPVTRHGFFTVIIWATLADPHKYMDMKWEPEKGKYFTPFTQKLYLLLFLLLDVIMIYWFSMIVRIVFRVIQGKNAEDTRSDDEDDDEENPVDNKKNK